MSLDALNIASLARFRPWQARNRDRDIRQLADQLAKHDRRLWQEMGEDARIEMVERWQQAATAEGRPMRPKETGDD